MRFSITSIMLLSVSGLLHAQDATEIIQRSVAANQADWKAAPGYSYVEEDRAGENGKTYEVTMILGSPYRRLIKVNGSPLSSQAQQKERNKLRGATAKRQAESPSARQARIEKYEKGRKRDHILMEQLTKAFDFALIGGQTLDSGDVFVLRATPRAGYIPPNIEARVLPGMAGELWIDKQTFQWVKVTARVLHPVFHRGVSGARGARNLFRTGKNACRGRCLAAETL